MEHRAGRSGNYIRKGYEGDVDSSWVFKNRVFCPVPESDGKVTSFFM